MDGIQQHVPEANLSQHRFTIDQVQLIEAEAFTTRRLRATLETGLVSTFVEYVQGVEAACVHQNVISAATIEKVTSLCPYYSVPRLGT